MTVDPVRCTLRPCSTEMSQPAHEQGQDSEHTKSSEDLGQALPHPHHAWETLAYFLENVSTISWTFVTRFRQLQGFLVEGFRRGGSPGKGLSSI